jgi:CRISPR-associated endonuclease/helicase Cas3
VDQLGSQVLFRGYGHSLLTAPIFAGLAGNDSLVMLDEAHCAVPFMHTMNAIRRYRSPVWAEDSIPNPWGFVLMSATLPQEVPAEAIFPGSRRDEALDHPELRRRYRTSKLAELVAVAGAASQDADPLIDEAVKRALRFVDEGRRRVAVMVNRVRTAGLVAERLQAALSKGSEVLAHVLLLTGRIRPFERDELVGMWTPYLRANRPEEPDLPIVVVATQCLEVGADFSFDALVTECASLDALRQRFGRLARFGSDSPVPAAIVARQSDVEARGPDPIYGHSLAGTWEWLREQAGASSVVDMAVETIDARLRDVEDYSPLVAQSKDAPVLLPAHLDLLCQTAPPAHPQPDISLYLHGKPTSPEVSVVWRCDLPETDPERWVEIVSLCPPVSGEMLQVPLWRVRAWLAQGRLVEDFGDVEGVSAQSPEDQARLRPCLLWRGRDHSWVTTAAADLRPGDVLVVPSSYGIEDLGQATRAKGLGRHGLDLWEAARDAAGQPAAVRICHAVLAPWIDHEPLKALLAASDLQAYGKEAIADSIQAVLDFHPQEGQAMSVGPPGWWLDLLRAASAGTLIDHPAGGVIVFARETKPAVAEPDLFADDDDLTSAAGRQVALDDHSRIVCRAAEMIAQRCLPEGLAGPFTLAALWHDSGKLDPRFQILLHNGDEVAAASATSPIAKSASVPSSAWRRRAIRETVQLPENFRHEMLSVELARRYAPLPREEAVADLVLHLIASHHGHGRPFAPVVNDPCPPDITGSFAGVPINFDTRARQSCPPAHHLDSRISERFWRLTRRYGWWGLAYLEALLRLADWYGSRLTGASGGS